LPDPYHVIEQFYNIEKWVKDISTKIPWDNKKFKLFSRAQNVANTFDLGDDCVEDAYNGKNSRLGAIFEGLKDPDFFDARYSQTVADQ